jgi:hypothetical protein
MRARLLDAFHSAAQVAGAPAEEVDAANTESSSVTQHA